MKPWFSTYYLEATQVDSGPDTRSPLPGALGSDHFIRGKIQEVRLEGKILLHFDTTRALGQSYRTILGFKHSSLYKTIHNQSAIDVLPIKDENVKARIRAIFPRERCVFHSGN